MATKATEAQIKYDKANCRNVIIRVHKDRDADIISHLQTKESMQGYIKALILADIAKEAEVNGK